MLSQKEVWLACILLWAHFGFHPFFFWMLGNNEGGNYFPQIYMQITPRKESNLEAQESPSGGFPVQSSPGYQDIARGHLHGRLWHLASVGPSSNLDSLQSVKPAHEAKYILRGGIAHAELCTATVWWLLIPQLRKVYPTVQRQKRRHALCALPSLWELQHHSVCSFAVLQGVVWGSPLHPKPELT